MFGEYSFHVWSAASLVILLILATALGKRTDYGPFGILVDDRGRYSLTHFQTVLWTVVILSSFAGAVVASGFDPTAIILPPELLGLIGVSAGSAVFATATKASKDVANASIPRWTVSMRANPQATDPPAPHWAQIWLEEEGRMANKTINITKFQNFVFTVVVVGVYIGLAVGQGQVPSLPENVVALIGVSHAGYVGGKMPNRA